MRFLSFFASSFVCAALLAACGENVAEKDKSAWPRVSVTQVAPRQLVETLNATGTMVPQNEIRVTAQVDGLAVVSFKVDEGDRVKKGDVLAVLDDVNLKAQLAQNTANLARAAAAALEARKALERTTTLRAKGISSQEMLDQKTSAARVANADESAVQAMRTDLETKLERTSVRAPVDGTIAKRNARIGAIANASEPLFTMIADNKAELAAQIADTQHARVRPGEPAQIFLPGIEQGIPGRVRIVSPQIDPLTRLAEVRVAVESDEQRPVGGFARAVIETARKQALAAPLSGVTYENGKATVQKIVDEKVVTQGVTTGIVADGWVEIVSGLNQGDVIVTRAGTFLRNGDNVVPVN